MFGISLTAALPLLSLTLAYALKGGRNPQAFAIAVIPLVCLPFCDRFRDHWFSNIRRLRPLFAVIGWAIISLVALPPVYLHLARLSLLASYVMFATAAALWTDREKRVFLGVLLCLGLIESITFLLLHMKTGSVNGYLAGNPIYTALAAAAPLLAIAVFSKGNNKSFLIPAAVLLTVAVALTRSRSALAGFIVAAAFMAPRRRYLTGLIVLAATFFLLGVLDFHRLLSYLKIDFTHPEDIFGRLTIWRSSLAASFDNPVFGWGLGNFEAGYLRHQLPVDMVLRFDRSTIFAHNDLLQLAVEAGWIGAAFGVWALVSFTRSVRTKLSDPMGRWAAATMTLYAIAGLFNFTLFLPFNGFVAAAAFGMGTGGSPKSETTPRAKFMAVWVIVPVFLFAYASLNGMAEFFRERDRPELGARILPCRSDLWYEAALKTLNERTGGWAVASGRALGYLHKTLKWNSQDPFAWDRLAMVEMTLPDLGLDPSAAFSQAIDLAPMHAPFWLDAGFERLRADYEPAATEHFLHAAELEPNAPLCWFALAVTAQERGDHKKASEYLEKAVALGNEYRSIVPPSGYASYLFGMDEKQMRSALSARRVGGSSSRS